MAAGLAVVGERGAEIAVSGFTTTARSRTSGENRLGRPITPISRKEVSEKLGALQSPISASWNQIYLWIRAVDGLRRAA